MAKTLILCVITTIVLSLFQVSLAQELVTHKNSPWVKKEAPTQCQGKIGLVEDLISENPYSTEGKCYLIQTAPYEHGRQYLDRSTAILFFSQWSNGRNSRPVWINYGEKLFPYDFAAWFMGMGAMEYKDASGALQTISKLKFVKMRAENQQQRRVGKDWESSAVFNSRTIKEAPPECGQQVKSFSYLLADNPFDTNGKCYFIYSPELSARQLLGRNKALYIPRGRFGRGGFFIDFDKIDAPAETQPGSSSYWNAYVMGLGAYQYESTKGILMTVPQVKVIKLINKKH